MRLGRSTLLGVCASLGALAASPLSAEAAVSCSFSAPTLTVSMTAAGDNVSLGRNLSTNELFVQDFSGAGIVTLNCGGTPTNTNTDTINITDSSGGATLAGISGAPRFEPGVAGDIGPDEIEVNVNLGGQAGDELFVSGTADNNAFAVDPAGIDTNFGAERIGQDDNDIFLSGVPQISVQLRDGDDWLSGQGRDPLEGPTSTPILFESQAASVESGDDVFIGGSGNDLLDAGAGADTIDGGLGADTLRGQFGSTSDGPDTVSYATAGSGVVVDLGVTTQQNTGGAGLDTLRNFENLTGSAFGDELLGSPAANRILGGDGDDRITGGRGRDKVFGEEGVDKLFEKERRRDRRIDCGPGLNSQERARFDSGKDPQPKSC